MATMIPSPTDTSPLDPMPPRPLPAGMANDPKRLARSLRKKGYAVLKTYLCDPDALEKFHVNEWGPAITTAPEYAQPVDLQTTRLSGGGFATAATPSATADKAPRGLRMEAYDLARLMFEEYVKQSKDMPAGPHYLQECVDAMMHRVPGQSAGNESWHKDIEGTGYDKRKHVFGGWWCLNRDRSSQYLVAIPGSHTDLPAKGAAGFSPYTKEEQKALSDLDVAPIEVKFGEILVFNQLMTHRVRGGATRVVQDRLFIGWRLSPDPTLYQPGLYPDHIENIVRNCGMFLRKSGQQFPFAPEQYYSTGLDDLARITQVYKPELRGTWTVSPDDPLKRRVVPSPIYERTEVHSMLRRERQFWGVRKNGSMPRDKRTSYDEMRRTFPSLRTMISKHGLKADLGKYTDYTRREIEILKYHELVRK